MAVGVLPVEAEKSISIASGLGWGATLGGVQRVSPTTSSVLSFMGAIGGLIGAMTIPDPVGNNIMEGIAAASAGVFGLGLTAPKVSVTAKKINEVSGPNKALLTAGQAAQAARSPAAVQVGVGWE